MGRIQRDRRTIIARMKAEQGGSEYAFRRGRPQGIIVALTNNISTRRPAGALTRARNLAARFAEANPLLSRSLVIGWWRSSAGILYIDTGIVLPPSTRDAHAVGRAFRQKAIARLTRWSARVIPVRRRSRAARRKASSNKEKAA